MTENGQAPAGRAALLIIDVQRALFEKTTPIYRAAEMLENIGQLIDRARAASRPVIFVQHVNQSFLAEGSDGWRLHPALEPAPDDLVLQKHHGSALQATPLHAHLRERGITTLVVTGLVTNGCVRATCQDAQRHGYRVVLVEDGHSTYQKKAAQIVAEWNGKLHDEGIELLATSALDFAIL